MRDLVFDKFCEHKQCQHLIYWEHDVEMHDHGRRYESTIECISCTLVGQSYNVDEYPAECPHLAEIKEWEEEQIALRTWNAVTK